MDKAPRVIWRLIGTCLTLRDQCRAMRVARRWCEELRAAQPFTESLSLCLTDVIEFEGAHPRDIRARIIRPGDAPALEQTALCDRVATRLNTLRLVHDVRLQTLSWSWPAWNRLCCGGRLTTLDVSGVHDLAKLSPWIGHGRTTLRELVLISTTHYGSANPLSYSWFTLLTSLRLPCLRVLACPARSVTADPMTEMVSRYVELEHLAVVGDATGDEPQQGTRQWLDCCTHSLPRLRTLELHRMPLSGFATTAARDKALDAVLAHPALTRLVVHDDRTLRHFEMDKTTATCHLNTYEVPTYELAPMGSLDHWLARSVAWPMTRVRLSTRPDKVADSMVFWSFAADGVWCHASVLHLDLEHWRAWWHASKRCLRAPNITHLQIDLATARLLDIGALSQLPQRTPRLQHLTLERAAVADAVLARATLHAAMPNLILEFV